MEITIEDVAIYLGKAPFGTVEDTESEDQKAFRAIFDDGSQYAVKVPYGMRAGQLSLPTSGARKERSLARRTMLLGGIVSRPVAPKSAPVASQLDGRIVRSPRDMLAVYEWIEDGRPVELVPDDQRAALDAWGRTDAAAELAGRQVGPFFAYPNAGPSYWQTVPTNATLLGHSGGWIDLIAEHAETIGLLEMSLPLLPNYDSRLWLSNIHGAPGIFRNILIRDDGSGVLIDLEQIQAATKENAARSAQFVFGQSDEILGKGESRKIYERAHAEVMSRYGQRIPETPRTELSGQLGSLLSSLRSHMTFFGNPEWSPNGALIERFTKELLSLAPIAHQQGLMPQTPVMAIERF